MVDALGALLEFSSVGLVLLFYVIVYLIVAVLLAWIIKLGVRWAILNSGDEIRAMIREAILSTQPAQKRNE